MRALKKTDNKEAEIMKYIAEKCALDWDGTPGDLRLHDRETISVDTPSMNKTQYTNMEKMIDLAVIDTSAYTVYAWNDSSGYKYWSQEDDYNYIQVTVNIKDITNINITYLRQDFERIRNMVNIYNMHE